MNKEFKKTNQIFKFFAIFVLFLYITVPIFGFLSINNMDHSHNMHFGLISDCPYVENGSSFCPLNLFSHLNIFKNLYLVFFDILIIFYLPLLFLFFNYILFDLRVLKLLLYKKRFIYQKIKFLYQELFTTGLLIPKVF